MKCYRNYNMTNDKWRYEYVGENTWMLDTLHNYNPEDSIIDAIDAIDGCDTTPERISGVDMMTALDERQYKIVWMYLWKGYTFEQIGDVFGFTKQRAHQIYWEAVEVLSKLYPSLTDTLLVNNEN